MSSSPGPDSFPEPTPQLAESLLRRHGLQGSPPRRAAQEGIANAVFVAEPWVVRIAKDPELVEDAATEVAAAPLAWKGGVRTPELAAWGEVEPGIPYSIFRWAPGEVWARAGLVHPQFYTDLARELKICHSLPCDPGCSVFDEAWLVSHLDVLDASREEEVQRLALLLEGPLPQATSFVHQDLHPENVVLEEGRLSALLDWGDAGFGDPACDFRYIPASRAPLALEAYESPDRDLPRRVALHVLDQWIYARDRKRSYGPWADSTWTEVKAFAEWAARQ